MQIENEAIKNSEIVSQTPLSPQISTESSPVQCFTTPENEEVSFCEKSSKYIDSREISSFSTE
jgi:hypothetical protein